MRLFLFLFWPIVALAGPLLTPGDPNSQELADAMLPPVWLADGSSAHPLGTDQLGRDILLRVIYGAQSSLALGIIAVAGSATVGSLAGVAAAQGGVLADRDNHADRRHPAFDPVLPLAGDCGFWRSSAVRRSTW